MSAGVGQTELAARLRDLSAEEGLDVQIVDGEPVARVDPSHVPDLLLRLRDDDALAFAQLTDLTVVDRPEREPRFDVVYLLFSPDYGYRMRVYAGTAHAVPSVVAVHPAAGWLEREAFDLFGIDFVGHPDLRRILLEPGFEGHPLRKQDGAP